MARARKEQPKGPDWPPEQTLPVLKVQLEELNKFVGRSYLEYEQEEDTWEQFTRNVMIHGFGEASQNLNNFTWAKEAGTHNIMGISDRQRQINFQLRIEKYQATLKSSIKELEITLAQSVVRPAAEGSQSTPATKDGIFVLISHSSKDADLALALIELLRAGLGLLPNQIRCSSVDGYRLPAGVVTDTQLRSGVAARTQELRAERATEAHQQRRRPVSANDDGAGGALHSGAVWRRQRSAEMGTEACGTRRKKCQETSGGCRGSQVGGTAPSAVGERRGVRTIAQ
jgi:hypothetical protein